MDRVYAAGAIETPPDPPASPSPGYPTAGNPATAVPATKPGPWWYHQVTEEIRNVILLAGVEPDHTQTDQLATAVAQMISDAIPDAPAHATDEVYGVVRFGTEAEALGGGAGVVLSPELLRAAMNAAGGAPMFAARAWVVFNGKTTPPSILYGGNIAAITRVASGRYTVSFIDPMPTPIYSVTGGWGSSESGQQNNGISTTAYNHSEHSFDVSTSAGNSYKEGDLVSLSIHA